MKELLVSILNFFGLACWLEISTDKPRCVYYFGPFLSAQEAKLSKDGYLYDLQEEGAKEISFKIKRFKPNELTIFEELTESYSAKNFLTLNSQPSLNI